MPRLMPRSGTSTSITARAARRNVPSPPSTTSDVGRRQLAHERLESLGRRRPSGRCRASGTSPRRVRAARRPPRWSGCRRSRSGSTVTRVRRRRPAPRRPRPPRRSARRARRHDGPDLEVEQELAVALRAQDRRRDRAARLEPERRRRGAATALEHRADGRPGRARRRPSTSPRPASNCGLTRATIVAAAVAEARTRSGRGRAQRDERDVDDGERDRLRAGVSGVSVRALVRSIDTTRGSRAERLGELPAADVDGVDAARAALEQDVGEAAGRGADVEADAARPDRSPKASSAAASLCPPRLTYGSGARRLDRRRPDRRDRRACDRVAPHRRSPTRTWPASSSAWARARGLGEAALDEQLVEADALCALRSRGRSPAYRGTARCTRGSTARVRTARGAASARRRPSGRPGVARSAASGLADLRRRARRHRAGGAGAGR